MTPRDAIYQYLETQADIRGINTLTDTIIAALDAAGYAIVPKAPTKEMCEAGNTEIENCTDEDFDSGDDGEKSWYTTIQSDAPFKIYQAMLGAIRAQQTGGSDGRV